MIISRTPLRISLGGGGTDLPAYYASNGGGFLVAAAITKYVHVAVHENFVDRYLLKYSEIEDVEQIDDVAHPLIREALKFCKVSSGIEISSLADIPAGTGLGSSGTFTVGLLKALHAHQRHYVSNETLAEQACVLEIEKLNEPVGKQDQYIAAIGGITAFEFHEDESVSVMSVEMPQEARGRFEDHLMLFYTGVRRSASEELRALEGQASIQSSSVKQNLDDVREAGRAAFKVLGDGDLDSFGKMMIEQWKLKLARSPSVIHSEIDSLIHAGINGGASGGKLVGAGGGGFLLFLADDKQKVRAVMREKGLREVTFGIDYQGTAVDLSAL